MKNFKKILGVVIIIMLFIGIFACMVQYSSLEIVFKAFGTTLTILAIVVVGVVLVNSD